MVYITYIKLQLKVTSFNVSYRTGKKVEEGLVEIYFGFLIKPLILTTVRKVLLGCEKRSISILLKQSSTKSFNIIGPLIENL